MKKNLKSYLAYLISIIVSLLLFGCGGSSTGDSSYTLSNGNHALLGPLSGATVKICELAYSSDPVCVETKTDKLGTFSFSNTKGWSNDQIVLVIVSGGEDVDYDDNGLLDAKPTPNKGIIRGFAKVGDLAAGRVNITVLTDIVYNYVNHLCSDTSCSLSYSDLENILDNISDKLVSSSGISSAATAGKYFGTVTKYNPLKPDDTPLKVSSTTLQTISQKYHSGDNASIQNALENTFRDSGLVIGNPTLALQKNTLKLTILKPTNATLEVVSGAQTINDSIVWLNKTESDTKKYTLTVKNIKDNYTLVNWMGCNSVSSDGTQCTVDNVSDDRIITPIILPKLRLNDNITIVDITGAMLIFDSSKVDSRSMSDYDINSNIFDNFTIVTDDQVLIERLNGLKKDDIIVNKSEPIFYRKVVSVANTNSSPTSGYQEYRILTVHEGIEKIIPSGHISTALTIENTKPFSPVQLLKSELVVKSSNGVSKIPFNPNQQYIEINFDKNQIYTINKSDLDQHWETNYEKTYGPVYFDSDNKSSLTGTLRLRPYVDLHIGWNVDVGWSGVDLKLDGAYLNMGADIELVGEVTAEIKKKYSEHKILYDGLQFTQTYIVYGIPIQITEKIPITYGIKGAGKGADFDKAMLVGNAKITVSGTSNPVFNFAYDGNRVSSYLDCNFNFSQTTDINIGANAFAYIGAEPGVYIYGIGVKMNNYLGPYIKIDFKAKDNASGTGTILLNDIITNNLTFNYSLMLEGTIGLGYYGRILASTTWDNSIAKKVTDKINEAIRGKYTEFWKEWPAYTVKKEWVNDNKTVLTKVPGELQVSGERNIMINELCGGKINKTYQYILTNIGDSPIEWEVVIKNTGMGINFLPSKLSGTINARDNTTVTLNISTNSIDCGDTRLTFRGINVDIDFNQQIGTITAGSNKSSKSSSLTFDLTPINTLTMVNSINKFKTRANIYATKPISWTSAMSVSKKSYTYNNLTMNMLRFAWNKPSDNRTVDGYAIFYAEKNGSCGQYRILTEVQGFDNNEYREYLGDTISDNKSYCFKVNAYKNLPLPLYIGGFTKLYFPPDNETIEYYP